MIIIIINTENYSSKLACLSQRLSAISKGIYRRETFFFEGFHIPQLFGYINIVLFLKEILFPDQWECSKHIFHLGRSVQSIQICRHSLFVAKHEPNFLFTCVTKLFIYIMTHVIYGCYLVCPLTCEPSSELYFEQLSNCLCTKYTSEQKRICLVLFFWLIFVLNLKALHASNFWPAMYLKWLSNNLLRWNSSHLISDSHRCNFCL